jgi:23S rRNA pseudouridine1911/1915/1917 synthase
MERRQIEKEYLAVVCGWPEWEQTTIDAPIARQGEHQPSAIWLKQMAHPLGAPALTDFQLEKRFVRASEPQEKFAVVRAIPHSGRTHQIRVHLAHLGHPLVGDKIYGPDEQLYLRFIESGWTEELAHVLFLPRHALHSARLRLEGEFDWRSDLPEDLRSWIGLNLEEKTPATSEA